MLSRKLPRRSSGWRRSLGLPIDLAVYRKDELRLTRYRRLKAKDPDLQAIRTHWEQSPRRAVQELPGVTVDVERS